MGTGRGVAGGGSLAKAAGTLQEARGDRTVCRHEFGFPRLLINGVFSACSQVPEAKSPALTLCFQELLRVGATFSTGQKVMLTSCRFRRPAERIFPVSTVSLPVGPRRLRAEAQGSHNGGIIDQKAASLSS